MEPLDCIEKDKVLTRANKGKLLSNRNLLLWYERLYLRQFGSADDISELKILEIGSGTSPLQLFNPQVITSDILELDYLDYIFDCHDIDMFEPIPDESLDVITMTNVLHHLKAPVTFLLKASRKLKPGGKVIMAEPFFSVISAFIYTHIHPEPVSFNIDSPVLSDIKGPLTSANIALPYQIFFEDNNWSEPLVSNYDFSIGSVGHFSSLSYMLTGGISKNFPIPTSIYRLLLNADIYLADRFPKLFSSFFILAMTKK